MADRSHWSWRNQLQDRLQVLPAPSFQKAALTNEIFMHPSQDSRFSYSFSRKGYSPPPAESFKALGSGTELSYTEAYRA